MMQLNGKRAVILVERIYNDFEFWIPYYRLKEAGAEVLVAGPEAGAVYEGKHKIPARADVAFGDVDPSTVHGLVVPGGYAPDWIRRDPAALELVRKVDQAGAPIAFICHAGWVLISAGILKGRKCTSFSAIKDDMVNAGADWVDQEVVVDGNLISSRTPDDLPVFMPALIKAMSEAM